LRDALFRRLPPKIIENLLFWGLHFNCMGLNFIFHIIFTQRCCAANANSGWVVV